MESLILYIILFAACSKVETGVISSSMSEPKYITLRENIKGKDFVNSKEIILQLLN